MAQVVDTRNKHFVKVVTENATLGWLAFTAYIGAVVYFFSLDQTFWGFVLAVLKAIFWPGYLVFEALGALGAA